MILQWCVAFLSDKHKCHNCDGVEQSSVKCMYSTDGEVAQTNIIKYLSVIMPGQTDLRLTIIGMISYHHQW